MGGGREPVMLSNAEVSYDINSKIDRIEKPRQQQDLIA